MHQNVAGKSSIIGLILGVIAVSFASILIRFAQKEADSLVIAAYRLVIATIVLLPIVIGRSQKEISAIGKEAVVLLLLSGVFLAIHFAAWITSLEYTSITSSVVLVTTSPIWVALFSYLFLNIKGTKYLYFGLAIAFSGTVIIGFSQVCGIQPECRVILELEQITSTRSFIGNFLALVGAWSIAGYVIIGKLLRTRMSVFTYTFFVYGFGGLLLSLVVIVTGRNVANFQTATFGYLVGLALVPQLIGHTCFNWALRYLSANFVAVATLGEPVGSTILALIILNEKPSLLEVAGGIIILIGIYFTSRNESIQA